MRHGPAGGLGNAREDIEQRPELLRHGPSAALWALIDRVVDGYQPVAAGLANDIEEVEAAVFAGDGSNPVERIYRLRREVLQFHRAVDPARRRAGHARDRAARGRADPGLPARRRRSRRPARGPQVDAPATSSASILQANLTQVSVRQNEDMRKISAWVAIIAVPTAVAGIYGMNFEHMPELEWRFGYPAVLLLIACACGYLYVRFRRSGWL